MRRKRERRPGRGGAATHREMGRRIHTKEHRESKAAPRELPYQTTGQALNGLPKRDAKKLLAELYCGGWIGIRQARFWSIVRGLEWA